MMSMGNPHYTQQHQQQHLQLHHPGMSQVMTGAPLPTPPSSPYAPYHVESTIGLLESLTAFYHEERMWVYRTRASLELALQGKSFIPDLANADATTESSSTTAILPSGSVPTAMVAADEEKIHGVKIGVKEETTPSPSMMTPGQSKWLRRKQGYRLRLEGLSFTRVVNGGRVTKDRPTGNPSAMRRQHRDSGVQILELFEKMMQARMESCERVTRMVRNANAYHDALTGPAGVDMLGGRIIM